MSLQRIAMPFRLLKVLKQSYSQVCHDRACNIFNGMKSGLHTGSFSENGNTTKSRQFLCHHCKSFSNITIARPRLSASAVHSSYRIGLSENNDNSAISASRKECLTCFMPRRHINLHSENNKESMEEMSAEEKAEKFQRPKAQSTIDEEEVLKFASLSALWWDEGGEFEALHSLNELRIPLIRDAMMSQKSLDEYNAVRPLEGFWILDVGSGGGILSEPLARLGANVIGLETSQENIKTAQAHLMHDLEIRDRIKYIQATVEEMASEQPGRFDAVVASEVLEHVADANTFVSASCQLVKPGGSIFFTTLNKTAASYALGVVVAERVLQLVSPGTHDWDKFIAPSDVQYMLDKNDFSTRLVHGMWYNPLSKRWSWTKDVSINYAIHAVRAPLHEPEDVHTETES